MTENTIIQFLTWAVVIEALGLAFLYLTARNLPLAADVVEAFWGAIKRIIPLLRRLFDPNTALALALKSKGIPAELADMAAEWGADQLEEALQKHIANES